MPDPVAWFRFEAKVLLGNHPAIYLPIARWRRVASPFRDSTEIVIEGFPRSGNTFAVAAFEYAQGGGVEVAHHEHVPASLLAAARSAVPSVVLLRNPEDAILSYLIQQPQISASQALRAYRVFYRAVEPVRDRMVVATFDAVTRDFGVVIRRVNERFGTSFTPFVHSPDNVEAVLAIIRADNEARFGAGAVLDRVGAEPSAARGALKEELRAVYRAPALAPARVAAQAVHDRLAAAADA